MQTLIVKTESEAAAKLLMAFLKTVRLVKSVTLSSTETKKNFVNEPTSSALGVSSPKEKGSGNNSLEPYNWTNPSRPATDEEIELMLDECEAQEGIPSREARKQTMKELREWEAKRRK